jgi:hypothetical protein
MTDRIRPRGVGSFLIALGMGAILVSATIVPPERASSCLRQKVGAEITAECKESPKTEAKSATNPAAPEIKKSTAAGHPHPDPIRNLLRGILL